MISAESFIVQYDEMVKAVFEFIADAHKNGYEDELSKGLVDDLLRDILTVGDCFTDPVLKIGIKKETLYIAREFVDDAVIRKWAVKNLKKLGVNDLEILRSFAI